MRLLLRGKRTGHPLQRDQYNARIYAYFDVSKNGHGEWAVILLTR